MQSYADNAVVQKHRWYILGAIGMFIIMSTLDGSIVNIALPVMSADLHIPMNLAEWVVSIYLIVICASLLFFGKLGDIVGKVRIFRIGTILFTIGSLFAGFNNSLILLLAARAVQAVGASMTMATSNGIITEVFPMKERGRALGMIGSFVAVGSIAGPGLGGIILAHLPWGYIFWINLPIGLITILIGQMVLPKDQARQRTPIDVAGTLTSMLGICALFGGIFVGQAVGFTNPSVLAAFAAAVVAFVVFGWVEQRTDHPLVAFKLFKNSEFTISLLAAFLIFVTNFFFNVIAPFYLQNARGLAPNKAGYMMMIFPIIQVVVAPLAGALSDKKGPYKLTLIGLILIGISQLGYTFLTLDAPLIVMMVLMALVGLGNGIFQSPNNTIVMSAVNREDLGVAGGMNAFARELGMVVGIATATTVLFSSMSQTAGHKVTTYVTSHPEWFIYGMHVAFWVATAMCLLAALLTAFRMRQASAKRA